MQISVSQHLLSSVPVEQFEGGSGGRTLSYTHAGLSEEEVSILEDRAQYFASDIQPVKYQFYALASGKAVISHITPLPEPAELGRRGGILAHSLILAPGDFQALDFCPLGLIRPQWFLSRLEEAFQQVDRNSGNIPTKIVEVSDAWQEIALKAAHAYPPESLLRMARLGWQAGRQNHECQPVALIGNLTEMFTALAVVFLLTKPSKRTALSFDTYVYGCDWERDCTFWAWGGSRQQPPKANHYIETDIQFVESDLSPDSDSPFERWVAGYAIPNHLETFLAQREQALSLEGVLQGEIRPGPELLSYDEKLVRDFTRVNANAVSRLVFSHLPKGLSRPLTGKLVSAFELDPSSSLKWLAGGVSPARQSELFYQLALVEGRELFSPADYKILSALAMRGRHYGLHALVSLYEGDRVSVQKSLDRLSSESYQRLVQKTLPQGRISALDAFSPVNLSSWCALCAKAIQPGDLKTALEGMKNYQTGWNPDPLASLIPDLSDEDRSYLMRWISGYPGLAPRLRAAVKNMDKPASSPTEGLGDKLKSLLSTKRSPIKK